MPKPATDARTAPPTCSAASISACSPNSATCPLPRPAASSFGGETVRRTVSSSASLHPISRPYEQTSIIATTNLAFGAWTWPGIESKGEMRDPLPEDPPIGWINGRRLPA